jgi:hypothetical protein
VTESGILTADDVRLMRSHQVHSFLVGEAFMRQDDPGAANLFFPHSLSQPGNQLLSAQQNGHYQWPFCWDNINNPHPDRDSR